jgi:hypothetical protein
MYRPTHEPIIMDRMISERYAAADGQRLAKLARAGRSPRPSVLARVSGRVASVVAPLRHVSPRHTATHAHRP